MSYLIAAILLLALVAYVSQLILESSYKDYDDNGEPLPTNNYYEPIRSEVNITTEPNTEYSSGVIDLRKRKNIVAEAVEEAVQVVREEMAEYIGAPSESTTKPIITAIKEVIKDDVAIKPATKPRTRKPRAKKEVK